VAITVSTCPAVTSPVTRSPVRGLTPPLARVAAMVAMSVVVTSTEHCRK
jgi:hypothetical protein